ncbi:alpha/beta hydrolase family protein [Alkalicoccobacillus plakortidis]|uniref:Alpha/beta fold hydrolase n=1 Tax=Alkalicoccobacillus plakortidis TaxID=444060 RepID=A0ABT0XEA4_9BACI|nr:alpha/beta fold hydrolase [Alkalicoccobacillus plakortidis]MCM2674231.1 alpha/beta fold hydrolase [Alkalicoccobacillus plakortidis]
MAHSLVSLQVKNEHLSGAVHLPDHSLSKTYPAVIFIHGFVGSKVGEHRLFVKASRYLAQKGYASFRFDFSGCGESSGDYRHLTVSKQIQELLTIIDYVKNHPLINENQVTLIGHSLGGATSALVAAQANIHQLILWSAVAQPYQDIVRITGNSAVKIAQKEGVFDYHGFEISHSFFQDLRIHQPLEAISAFKGNVLILHAEQDEDVAVTHAESYAKATQTPSTPIYIKKANHTFASTSWEHKLFEQTANWLSNHQTHRGHKSVEMI